MTNYEVHVCVYDREFQYGGNGTAGHALLLGHCMDW